MYRGDVLLGKTVDFSFTTVDGAGLPATLAGSPAVAAYVDDGDTEITAGITLTVDKDGRTGRNHVRAVLSAANGFAAGTEVLFTITAGTVDGASVVGYDVAHYSIQNRSFAVDADGAVSANLTKILGTLLTETAGLLAAGFKKFFNVAAPTGTVNSLPDAVPGAAGGLLRTDDYTAPPTAIAVADQVWDEAVADHLGAGSTGAALNGAGSAGDPWATPLPGAYGAGTAGNIVGNNLDAPVSGVAAAVWAAGSRTLTSFGTLVADVATAVWGAGSRTLTGFGTLAADAAAAVWSAGTRTITAFGFTVDINSNADLSAVKAKTDALPADPASESNVSAVGAAVLTRATPAEVAAELAEALNVDTYPEPGQGAPPATATLAQKIGYLFKAWRNKHTQDGTEYKLLADDGVTVDQKAAVSDDGTTFTRDEVATGP